MRTTLLLALLLAGCSCGGPAPASPPSRSDAYSVHEWGLVRAGPGDTLAVGMLGSTEDLVGFVEKPVLYFHTSGSMPVAVTTARVTAIDGEIREHWPWTGDRWAPMPTTVTWGPLTIGNEHCGLAIPVVESALPCAALPPGEDCESLELARAVTEDAACVRFGALASPFLFYRSTSRGLSVPVRASLSEGLHVTNTGSLAIPGRMMQFHRDGGRRSVALFEPPAPGETIVVSGEWVDATAARAALTSTLTGLGLTASEAAAFGASWDESFFGVSAVELREEDVPEEPPDPSTDSLLYFLPPEMIEHISTLAFDPPPTEVRRAMAVWTAL
jgi:hypothetical protein